MRWLLTISLLLLVGCGKAELWAQSNDDAVFKLFADAAKKRMADLMTEHKRMRPGKERIELKKMIDRMQKRSELPAPQMDSIAINSFGSLSFPAYVFQVLDERSFLGRAIDRKSGLDLFQLKAAVRAANKLKAGQLLTPEERELGKLAQGPLLMFIAPTKGLADGDLVSPTGVFQVVRTDTYETAAGGTKTVLVVEPLDKNRIEPYLPKGTTIVPAE